MLHRRRALSAQGLERMPAPAGNLRCLLRCGALSALTALLASIAAAAEVQLRVAVDRPGHTVSPQLYGIFFEDINFGGDGGLNAELVKNGGFEFPWALLGWSEVRGGSRGRLSTSNDAPWRTTNAVFLRIETSEQGPYGAANEGFRGMGFRAGEPYRFTAQARSVAGRTALLVVRLVDPQGKALAESAVDVAGSEWRAVETELVPTADEGRGSLQLLLAGPGLIDLDMASLCPVRTWRERPHGLRADLVQKLAELQPAFFRFPGGCIVEGPELKYRYQWKTTIGDLAERRLLLNRWNAEFAHRLTPDYFQSFGVGFFEYFQLSEDLGAAPLPILNCGMACQFNSKELVALDALEPYIDNALDLIEFANGGPETPWGARRAALGHPAPFGLTMLGIGNEQWGPQYLDRYERIAAVLKEKHPEIRLVSGSGPFPVGADFDYAWSRLRPQKAEAVDEHCYACPDWFQREATRYDSYPRGGSQVFMGEYAAQSIDICSPDNRNNLRCALAEAAFLTGIERNSDVVAMSCYAPLFGHEEAWQWRPTLIWFDSLPSYATPTYYAQQLFSRHRADVVLPIELVDPRPRAPAGGRIGVGANDATVEFRGITVAREGETLWRADQLADVDVLERFRGRWELDGDTLAQTAPRATCRALLGDCDWRDYVVRFQARKTGGPGGFAALVRGTPGGSFVQWNIGAAGNTQHTLQAFLARHSTENPQVAATPGSIEEGRWYDVRIELSGPDVRCYLDDKLVHEATIPALELPWLYAVAGRDAATREVVVKAVHVGDKPVTGQIDLGSAKLAGDGARIVALAGDPHAVNSLDEPEAIAPQTSTAKLAGPVFVHEFAPHSLTVLRFPVQ